MRSKKGDAMKMVLAAKHVFARAVEESSGLGQKDPFFANKNLISFWPRFLALFFILKCFEMIFYSKGPHYSQ